MKWTQLDWSTQLYDSLECYNVTTEEGEEYLWNINISEIEGHHKVEGPQVEYQDMSTPL